MAVTMSQLLAQLDREEPDYAEAARLGADALPLLQQILQADDPMRASKAAYLAGMIGGSAAVPVLQQAAAHHDPVVRVAAAHAHAADSDTPQSVLETLLGDSDAGVRKVAIRAAQSSRSRLQLKRRIADIAAQDPEAHIRTLAADVARGL